MITFNSIAEMLDYQSSKYKNKTFIEFENEQFSYNKVNKIVTNLAYYFRQLGLKKGDIFCIMTTNCPEFIFTWFALNKIGVIMTPINPSYKENEVNYIFEHTETNYCLVDEKTKDVVKATGYRCNVINVKQIKKLYDSLKNITDTTTIKYSQEDIAAILYTSGTTGKPKGVMLPNRTYIIGGEAFAFRSRLTDKDKIMAILPLFHVNAEIYSTMGALVSGAKLVLKPKFSASSFWQDVVYKKVTHINLLGVIAHILLKTPPDEIYKKHKIKVAFGGDIDIETFHKFKAKFGITLLQPLSLTECPMGTSNLIDDNKIGSVGKPAKHPNAKYFTEVKIVDDSGIEVEHNQPGEIVFKSPALALGYYKNSQATAEAFKNNWFYTGDYGKKDKDGYVYFIDRKKDIIRKRGECISPKEIELVIMKIPAIEEVAVIPIPSIFGGENIKAYIVLKPNSYITNTEIRDYCRSELADYKTPDIFEFVAELPKTATHKINKSTLKERHNVNIPSLSSDVYILAGIRTPIGKFYGQLKDIRGDILLTHCLNYLDKKYNLKRVDEVITGCANQSGEASKNTARSSVLLSSLESNIPVTTVTKSSASGADAIRIAASLISSRSGGLLIAAGVESLSRAPFVIQRKNKKEPEEFAKPIDSISDWRIAKKRIFNIMEKNMADIDTYSKLMKISRDDQDMYAYNSNARALKYRTNIQREILPIEAMNFDEIPREDITLERLHSLPPLYNESLNITAGNTSKLADGAAAILLGSIEEAKRLNVKPLAQIAGSVTIATEPAEYTVASVYAVNKLLNQFNLTLDDIGVIEIHEAYALQVLACVKLLRTQPSRINAYGGAISLGHPFGMSGVRLVLTAVNQMHEKNEKYGLVTIPGSTGQAVAILLKLVI